MIVQEICAVLEDFAPLALQESYDNAGLQVGKRTDTINGILLCIDITENVIDEAIRHNCNLIISHHPLIFKGLKRLTGDDYVQSCVIKAIQNDIAIYSAHTNLDSVMEGVNGRIAQKIGLTDCRILAPEEGKLLKLVTFVPIAEADKVRESLFAAGAGRIGNYDSCSYNSEGFGTFRASEKCNPFVGKNQRTSPRTGNSPRSDRSGSSQVQCSTGFDCYSPIRRTGFRLDSAGQRMATNRNGNDWSATTTRRRNRISETIEDHFQRRSYPAYTLAGQADKKSCCLRRFGSFIIKHSHPGKSGHFCLCRLQVP